MRNAAPKEQTSILQDVRDHCRAIMERADHVRIRHDRIPAYAADILARYPLVASFDERHLVSDDPEEMASYVMAVSSLNFGSGYFGEAAARGEAQFDYATLTTGLRGAFETGLLDRPAKWVDADEGTFHDIFSIEQGASAHIDALFGLFTRHLRADGKKIAQEYGGSSLALVDAAGGSAERFVAILASWPTFADTVAYKGMDGPVLKRAQITASYLHLCGLGGFGDMHALTAFADNRIPHVLRCDGILEYGAALARKIDDGAHLEPGSAMEAELRAAGVHAIELMRDCAARQGRGVTATQIDHILWNRGEEDAFRRKDPHRTLCVWY